ncbi:ABC-type cobalamin/Fe3+-siderophores transport systems, ATPase component [Solibacillus silvestris StLB046]|uniref:ABC-type cobalamin/Fe3+-siderophores transport systems, ATPase component n=1 Tax=Solibacillus silvestris (strain StLB046) TaxID=1002809 RepID=F2F0A2_SOLSS|nr:ABC transporter ATP-binding protein [Solibacillus silvestris]BAK15212.1 ABC-type cobalamin/Fe3+-siderophores transport systems, ATPase component [Solibacillus silvestris StLB046]
MKIEVREGNFCYAKKKEVKPFIYESNISFTLEPGKIMAILGPNGAGKTTLLKCITGLQDWRVGETLIDDVPLAKVSQKELWKKIGYVPQAHKMVFGFSIEDLVVMGRAPYIGSLSKPRKEDYEKAHEALNEVGIMHLAKKSCNEVSGGELQLALIARTLVSNPEILILDEPESHLDVQKQVVILETLKRLAKEHRISCIINTHYPNHAFYLADQVLMIAKEKKAVIGAVHEVMTESRMKEYFNIDLRKLIFEEEDLLFETMVPLALAAKRDISECRFNSFE